MVHIPRCRTIIPITLHTSKYESFYQNNGKFIKIIRSNTYDTSGQQPQYTQYQEPQAYDQQPAYQQTTYQGQPYQQVPVTQTQYAETQTQQPFYQNNPYQNDQQHQATYQSTQNSWIPQQTQAYHHHQQPQAQYQSAQLTQQSLYNLPRPARDNMNVYLRENQNFERVPQGLETRRNVRVEEWNGSWEAVGRR